MNPLLKKEIRLILPAWGITILLVVAPHILFHQNWNQYDLMWPVWLGILILCASSFGREFSLGTFSSLLALPVSRKQFWFVKIGVLVAALCSVLLFFFISLGLFHAMVAGPDEGFSVVTLGLFLLTAIAGGLWMALLIRQTIAVVWLIVLVPLLLCAPLLLLLSHFNAADQTVETTLDVLLLAYSVAGIAGSWLMFRRAQDAPWSGSMINLPDWMSAGIMQRTSTDERLQVPWQALIRKEFQFNQAPLLGMGVLFLVHLGVVGLRYLHRNPAETDVYWRDMNSLLQGCVLLWLFAPLIIGCASIAEERKLGTMEAQLCQPVSSRRQFLVKFGFILIMGGLLSTALLYLAEGIGMAIGAAPYHQVAHSSDWICGAAGLESSITGLLLAIAIVGFFASSLSRNLLQALPIAIGMIVGIGFTLFGFDQISGFHSISVMPGFVLWNPLMPGTILVLLLTVILPWLTYRNFRSLDESARIWRRNGLGLATVLLFTIAASVFIFHRTWEKLSPLEPAHGPARFTQDHQAVAMRTELYNNLQISLPDGRIWFACLANQWPESPLDGLYRHLANAPLAPRLVATQLMQDGNWTSLAAGYIDEWLDTNKVVSVESQTEQRTHFTGGRETVGIKADGTLWVSARPDRTAGNSPPLVQYGTETNWQEVVDETSLAAVVLLKKDGTLWRWGEMVNSYYDLPPGWPGLRAQSPRQIGTNADWAGLSQFESPVAQKTDGSIWSLGYDDKTHQDEIVPTTNFDRAGFNRQRLDQTPVAAWEFSELLAGVHPDGTLWIGGRLYWDMAHKDPSDGIQCGRETNWVAVAMGWRMMVALKSDGTLWRWGSPVSPNLAEPAKTYTGDPVRLGRHEDWIALAQVRAGIISLAADGSLWLWRDDGYLSDGGFLGSEGALIEPSEKPIMLGNILAAN